METTVRVQEQDLIFALDIGTRSIIGVLGRVEDERLKVLALEVEEHGKRAMLDGQIEDIDQVARVVRTVTRRLETRIGQRLERVCVAAAGRALRMERAGFALSLPEVRQIDDELISRLEAGAVSEAEALLSQGTGGEERRFYLVGYTVSQYRLDRYPLATLRGHNGRELEADVVATFLPGEVVESLYAAMRLAGLEVASLTLEPIAALNAAIPAELRLLNLVLADIGAGTSDIAVCREGSVVGYTMATVAGDEVTEAVMKAFLVDFKTAERMKAQMSSEEEVTFTDVLGLEQQVTAAELRRAVEGVTRDLAKEIAGRILEVNGGPPSALFLAGGGSKLAGLRACMAECLGVEERRVAVAGNNFHLSAFSETCALENPEYATPLGIAVTAGLGLVSDSYIVTLNGNKAKLFRSGALSALEILMMNGFTYADLIGRSGQSLVVTLDGTRKVFRGGLSAPSTLKINGKQVPPSTVVRAGDSIDFTPATHGSSAGRTLGALLGEDFRGISLVNGAEVPMDTMLHTGDVIRTARATPRREQEPAPAAVAPVVMAPTPVDIAPAPVAVAPVVTAPTPTDIAPTPVAVAPVVTAPTLADIAPTPMAVAPVVTAPTPADIAPAPVAVAPTPVSRPPLHITFNGAPRSLPPKEDGMPYYLMDLLHYAEIDFDHPAHPVMLEVNGTGGSFVQEIRDGDRVSIHYEEADSNATD